MNNASGYPQPDLTRSEALAFSVCDFIPYLANHLGQTFEEAEALFNQLPFNLWSLVDAPDGYVALAALFSPVGTCPSPPRPIIQ